MAPQPKVAKDRLYDIEDAKHVRKSVKKRLGLLPKKLITPARLQTLDELIKEATALQTAQGATSLDSTRKVAKDLVGDYRSAADLIVDGPEGSDADAEKALRMNVRFPPNDKKLLAYLDGIGDVMKPYADALDDSGFTKAQQAKLVTAAAAFTAAATDKGAKGSEASAADAERRSVFARLRTFTSWLRRVARRTFQNSRIRTEFDRVKAPVSKKKSAAKKTPAAKAAKTAKGKKPAPTEPPADAPTNPTE